MITATALGYDWGTLTTSILNILAPDKPAAPPPPPPPPAPTTNWPVIAAVGGGVVVLGLVAFMVLRK